jgi:hypothetical protein
MVTRIVRVMVMVVMVVLVAVVRPSPTTRTSLTVVVGVMLLKVAKMGTSVEMGKSELKALHRRVEELQQAVVWGPVGVCLLVVALALAYKHLS